MNYLLKCAPAVHAGAHFSRYFNMYQNSMQKVKIYYIHAGLYAMNARNSPSYFQTRRCRHMERWKYTEISQKIPDCQGVDIFYKAKEAMQTSRVSI